MPLTVHTHTHTRTCSTQGQNSLFTTWSNNVTWNTKLWVQQETERKGIIWQAQDLLSPLSSTFVIHPLYCGSHSRNTPHTHQTHVQHLGIFLPWSRGGWRVTLQCGTVQHKNRPFSPQDTISIYLRTICICPHPAFPQGTRTPKAPILSASFTYPGSIFQALVTLANTWPDRGIENNEGYR